MLNGSNILESQNIKHIHFIGIGGISMSGLAEILADMGYKVTGSDLKPSGITYKLEKLGIKVLAGHSEDNIVNEKPELVVYTAAVKQDNPELAKAVQMGIPTIDRATMLGQIMKRYPYSIAVSGTHGKTTTTSMVTMAMLEAGVNPTIHIGGELDAIGGNTKIGDSKYFVSEACEYCDSFLKFHPFLAIILNIELDHVDYFKDIDHIKQSFVKFASLVPKDGYVVACADDPNTVSILGEISSNIVTYGIKAKDAMWTAEGIDFDGAGHPSFDVLKGKEKLCRVNLNVPGIHNVNNALAAFSACYSLDCSVEAIKAGLEKFGGTNRRFELKGSKGNITVVDDYAHHPSEVKATLKAARNTEHSKIWCVFQPHTYTRTKSLMNEFSNAFADADSVIVADIYAARELDKGEIHASALAEKISSTGQNALYIHGFDNIVSYLDKNVSQGDLIITMGAGDIYKVGELYLQKDK